MDFKKNLFLKSDKICAELFFLKWITKIMIMVGSPVLIKNKIMSSECKLHCTSQFYKVKLDLKSISKNNTPKTLIRMLMVQPT